MNPRTEYNKAYYQQHKAKLQEINRTRQALLMQDDEKRKLKAEMNKKRYHAYREAYKMMKQTLDKLSLPGTDVGSKVVSSDNVDGPRDS